MRVQISSISGPVDKLAVKRRLQEFCTWLATESGASPTKEDPLVITIYDQEHTNEEKPDGTTIHENL